MNKYILLISVIVLLLIFFKITVEPFDDILVNDISKVRGKRYGIDIMHAKLNNYGGVDYVDKYPPFWRGEYSCQHVPCPQNPVPNYEPRAEICKANPSNPLPVPYPQYVKSNEEIVCWQCPSATDEPQYN